MTLPKYNSENVITSTVCKNEVGRTYMQWIGAILIATTLLNYGLQSGWVSPMKNVLQSHASPSGSPLTDSEMSWVASVVPLAAVAGTYLYSFIADKYGRKVGVVAMIVPQAICWLIKMLFTNPIALIIARIFAGLPAGGCFNVVPMYVKELSQDNIRGILVALSMTFTNIGYLAMYAMGSYLEYNVILWIAVSIPVIAGILFVVIVPESPAFLYKKGRLEDAANTVAKLRGLDINHKIVQNEMDYMKNQEEHFKTVESLTFVSIFKNKAWVRGTLLCMFNLTILDFNGILTINTYAWTIITNSGVTVNPELTTLSIPSIMIFGSLVSMTVVEKFGRKPILVGALALSAVSLGCLATTLVLQQLGEVTVPSWVPVVAIVFSVWSYAAGVLPMTYVILSEIFTFQVRSKLIGLIVTYAWFVSFVQVFSYLPITNAFGIYTTFYIYAGANLIGAVVCIIFLPETMGKNVEQIEQILLGNKVD